MRRVEPTRGGVVAMAILAILSIVGFVQTGVRASSSTLFQHTVDVHPSSGFGWQGLAAVRGRAGDWPCAVDAYRRALVIRPDDLQAMQDWPARTTISATSRISARPLPRCRRRRLDACC